VRDPGRSGRLSAMAHHDPELLLLNDKNGGIFADRFGRRLSSERGVKGVM
jgi:hypothetical protein